MARNNTIWNIGVIVGIAIALGGVLWGFAQGSSKIEENTDDIDQVQEQVDAVNDKATVNKETLIELKTNMKYIAATQTEIKDDMKEGFDRLEKAIKNEQ